MNRTIKEATVQRYHYDRHDQLEAHLADFINAYNYARRLGTYEGPHASRIHLQMLDFPVRTNSNSIRSRKCRVQQLGSGPHNLIQ